MNHISTKLVKSLKTMGLSQYEARTYAALVMVDMAGAKELVEFLDISKPSVYESLQSLEDMGLVMLTNVRPAVYKALEPELAIRLLMGLQEQASQDALGELKALEKARVRSRQTDQLWSIYGSASIDYKIGDMLKNASRSVYCTTSDRYLPFIKSLAGRGLSLQLLVLSDVPGLSRQLKALFQDDQLVLKVIPVGKLLESDTFDPGLRKITEGLDVGNMFELIVDDDELLTIPPVSGEVISGMHTVNSALIAFMKLDDRFLWENLERMARGQAKKAKARR